MNITLELFKEVIDTIKKTDEKQQQLTKAIESTLCTNSYCFVNICSEVSYMLIKLLTECMNIADKDLISWWLYEDVNKVIWLKDGTEFNVESVEDLYRYITEVLE